MTVSPISQRPLQVTLQRVVFENGHCLLPRQSNVSDYFLMLDDDVQKISGPVLSVHDTGIDIPIVSASSLEEQQNMTLSLENICGNFSANFENIAGAGMLMLTGAPRVGKLVKHRQFIGTHQLFHTIHGRIMYRMNTKMWSFKGARSLEDLVGFIRDLTEDRQSTICPAVSMLSVTLRTEIALIIDPVNSLLQKVIEKLYSRVLVMQRRLDDTNNLFFMDVVSWKELLHIVEHDKSDADVDGIDKDDTDVQNVRDYINVIGSDTINNPTSSIGFTRKGIFFIRITFPKGCVCHVEGSSGVQDAGTAKQKSDNICVGGVAPFINVTVRPILHILVKLRVVGGGTV